MNSWTHKTNNWICSCWTGQFLLNFLFLSSTNLNARHYSLSQHVSTCAFVVKQFHLVPTEAINQIACPAMHWYCCPFHLLPYIPRGTQKSNVHSYSPFIADSILSNSIKILTASSSTESGIWRKSVNRSLPILLSLLETFLMWANPDRNANHRHRGNWPTLGSSLTGISLASRTTIKPHLRVLPFVYLG